MIELKDYQTTAIKNLHYKIENSLRSSENEIVIFQAPTGSGKTVMVSQLLKDLVKNRKDDKKFSFVWVSVRMLHDYLARNIFPQHNLCPHILLFLHKEILDLVPHK